MNYSITGLAYLSTFLVLSYLLFRFFKIVSKQAGVIIKLLFAITFCFWLVILSILTGTLFFADNAGFLKQVINLTCFLESFIFAMSVFIVFHIRFKRISPWIPALIILALGLWATFLTIQTVQIPSLNPDSTINWGTKVDSFLSVLRFVLFMVSFFPLIITFILQLIKSEDPVIKNNAKQFIIVLSFAILVAFCDFLIPNNKAIWRDIALMGLSIAFIIILISQGNLKPEANKNIGQ
jgi:hypothetical protein